MYMRGRGMTGSLLARHANSPASVLSKSVGNSIGLDTYNKVAVPDVVGLTQAAETTAITDASLTVGTVTGTVDPVASQNPIAGSLAERGSSVDITLTA